MECTHSQLMQCPNCKRVWCVPKIVGNTEVWHRNCGQPLGLILSCEGVDLITRGTASWFRAAGRNEVQPDVG